MDLRHSKEYEIPQWQIDEVRERTEKYLKDPSSAKDIDTFLKEDDFELTDEMVTILEARLNELKKII